MNQERHIANADIESRSGHRGTLARPHQVQISFKVIPQNYRSQMGKY